MELSFERKEEFSVLPPLRSEIGRLLRNCFPEYPERSYFKQLPDFRYLVWENGALVAHMGVEHRIIRVGEPTFRVFGVADLCVDQPYQHKKIASTLLEKLEGLGKNNDIDFILLVAQEQGVYKSNGFSEVRNACKWLMIHEHQTIGVACRHTDFCLMIKPLNQKQWNPGPVDFLGHLF